MGAAEMAALTFLVSITVAIVVYALCRLVELQMYKRERWRMIDRSLRVRQNVRRPR